jgi:3-phenylpropionate/trans-cinnamate dioxygenase ferredoxin reductase subunit
MVEAMNKKPKKQLALLIYFLLIFSPLIILFLFPMPAGRDFWRDFSVALGFVGLSMAGLQFIPTARLRFLSDVFNMDQLYRLHHFLSVLSVFLVLMHPVILVLNNPYTLYLLNPVKAPWRAQAGLIGLAGLLLIAITSVLRKEVKLGYNTWHLIHDLLAVIIAVFALIHLFNVNYYMAAPTMRILWMIQIVIWLGMTSYLRIYKPLWMKKNSFVVDAVIPETHDTWTIVLKPVGHAGMDFNVAQVAWININSSPFTLHRNPFSISGSAHRKDELRFSIKTLGDFSSTIGDLKGGETVYVDGPYGSFSINHPATRQGLVLLAGGIGAAPVMSILHTLADQKDKRPVHFFYGNYNRKNTPFLKDLADLEKKLNLHITYVYESPEKDVTGEKGFITQKLLTEKLPLDYQKLFYFICGPLGMIHVMEKILHELQIPANQVSVEKYEMA